MIWTLAGRRSTVAYNFPGSSDGYESNGPLLLTADGRRQALRHDRGRRSTSGPAGFGVVYKIDPTEWVVAIVHTFGNRRDGAYPTGA